MCIICIILLILHWKVRICVDFYIFPNFVVYDMEIERDIMRNFARWNDITRLLKIAHNKLLSMVFVSGLISCCPLTSMAQTNWNNNPVGAVFADRQGEMPDGTYRFTSGGYEVFTIASADKDFQPASLFYGVNDADKQKVDAMVPDGNVPTAMNCFVVKTPDGYIMFDTGLPTSKGGRTLERMASLNIAPDDIKAVYLTHSHFDHIGGLLDDMNGAVFPHATIYVSADEMDFMKSTMLEMVKSLSQAYADRLVIFNFGDILPHNVLAISAKGHTPGHTAYQLGKLLFAGDLMHGASIQITDPNICANYDADRAQSIAARIKLLSYGVTNSLTVLGAHIPLNGLIF